MTELVAKFTVQGEPASKSRARFTKRGSKTVAYTPEKTKQAEERVAWIFRSSGGRPHTNDKTAAFGVEAAFYYSHNQRRDVDNMLKLILDGLNGLAWPDDVQVVDISARKSWVPKGEERTEVAIYNLGTIQRPTKDCERCGTPFAIYPSTAARQRFCGSTCARAYRLEQRERVCEYCHEAFKVWGVSKPTRYCSTKCSYAARSVLLTCVECGATFLKARSLANRGRPLCSDDCRTTNYRNRRTQNAKGACVDCDGPTSKKSYARCIACNVVFRGKSA